MGNCKPQYKGKRYNSLEEIKEVIRQEFLSKVKPPQQKQGNGFLSLSSDTNNKKVSQETLNKLKKFLSKTGISLNVVKDIVYNGKKINAVGIARIYKGVIDIVQGKEANVLPEEVFHFVTELIKQNEPELYKKLADKAITSGKLYKDTVDEYGDNPLYSELVFDENGVGKRVVDFEKIKDEVIAKLLDITLKNKEGNIKEGTKSFIKSAWDAIINLVKSVFNLNKPANLSVDLFEDVVNRVLEGDTFGNIQDLIKNTPNIKKSDYLALAPNAEKITFDAKNEYRDEIQKIVKEQSSKYRLVDGLVDPSITNEDDSYYEEKSTKNKFARLTRWIYLTFSPEEKIQILQSRKIGTGEANKYWFRNAQGRARTEGTVTYKNKELTYDELVDIKTAEIGEYAKRGTIMHKMVERYIKDREGNVSAVAILDNEIEVLKTELSKLTSYNIDSWFTNSFISYLLHTELGLDLENQNGLDDKIESELMIPIKQLGIVGTADMVVFRPNGNIKVIDLKTGEKFFNSGILNDLLKYSNDIPEAVLDNRETKAKLQLALQIFGLKVNNPDAKFDVPEILHVSKHSAMSKSAKKIGVDLNIYLKIIKNYLEEQSKTDSKIKDFLDELNDRKDQDNNPIDMFNASHYLGVSNDIHKIQARRVDVEGKTDSVSQMLYNLKKELNDLALGAQIRKEPLTKSEIKKIEGLINQVASMELEAGHSLSDNLEDINPLSRQVRDVYSIRKMPYLNLFFKIYDKALNITTRRNNEVQNKLWQLVKPLKDEYIRKNGNIKQIKFYVGNGTGMYDFMLEHAEYNEIAGIYAKILTEDDFLSGRITAAQWEFYKYFTTSIQNIWNEAMKEKIYFPDGSFKTKEDLYGRVPPAQYFIPRIPIEYSELLQMKFGSNVDNNESKLKTILQPVLKSMNDVFVQERYEEGNHFGVPIKWLGGRRSIESGEHSYNMEAALLSFMKNMNQKAEMDVVYSFGEGIRDVLNSKKTGGLGSKSEFKNTANYINDAIRLIVGDREDEIFTTFNEFIKTPWGKQVNVARVFEGINKATGASSMWFNKIGGFMNAIIQGALTTKAAISYSLSKRIGKYTQDVSPSLSYIKKAANIYLKHKVAKIDLPYLISGDRTKLLDNKLFRFAQEFRYDTRATMSRARDKDLQSARFRLLNEDSLYVLQSIGEDASLYTTMIAGLLSHKIRDGKGDYYKKENDKWVNIGNSENAAKEAGSMWDAYEIDSNTKEFKYTGPERGIRAINKGGEIVTGLTDEEIIRLKRYSQKEYGSYRDSEITPLEGNVLGSWVMKFKKYLPQTILNLWDARYNDETLGQWKRSWEKKMTKIDPKSGLAILEWEGMQNEGMYRILFMGLCGFIANKFNVNGEFWERYKWENMSPQQKHQFLSALVMITSGITAIGLGGLMFEPEDEDTAFYRRWVRLSEDQFGTSPGDMLNTIRTPSSQVVFMYSMLDSYKKFFFDSLILGERVKTGANMGDFKGWATIKRKTPILNIFTQFGVFDDGEYPQSTSWFINNMSYR